MQIRVFMLCCVKNLPLEGSTILVRNHKVSVAGNRDFAAAGSDSIARAWTIFNGCVSASHSSRPDCDAKAKAEGIAVPVASRRKNPIAAQAPSPSSDAPSRTSSEHSRLRRNLRRNLRCRRPFETSFRPNLFELKAEACKAQTTDLCFNPPATTTDPLFLYRSFL
ncbi:Uncharacterized protein HZ326_26352 [Fusarium oxysporum f. sp. albedinis]|nr:Uncharacterized protein HZ326_26352 [Fusarium oxysporum f. sp. albedinis]